MGPASIVFAPLGAAVAWPTLDRNFPTSARTFGASSTSTVVTSGPIAFDASGTHFGFVFDGPATVDCAAGSFALRRGMYFCVPGAFSVAGGRGLVVTKEEQRGLMAFGGPIENTGRLRYIDGCSDTLLISPPRLGDACLNLLILPPHTRQRMHDHPSVRVGIVVDGRGRCVTPEKTTSLSPGMVFSIPAGARHCFQTDDATMRVIAYHPDSDFGPQDDDHPMRNRTEHLATDASPRVTSTTEQGSGARP